MVPAGQRFQIRRQKVVNANAVVGPQPVHAGQPHAGRCPRVPDPVVQIHRHARGELAGIGDVTDDVRGSRGVFESVLFNWSKPVGAARASN